MGYRSDVFLALSDYAFEKLIDSVLNIGNPDLRKKVHSFIYGEWAKVERDGDIVFIRWNSVKWYWWGELPESVQEMMTFGDKLRYADVRYIMEFLNKLPKKEYKFVRYGEGRGDTERKGSLKVSKEKMR